MAEKIDKRDTEDRSGRISKISRRRSKKAGLPPGTPVYIGTGRSGPVKISVMDYTEAAIEERLVASIEECLPYRDTDSVTWINIDGVHNVEIIDRIGRHYGIHPLTIEDIVNTQQRPKSEDFDAYVFVVVKMISYNEKRDEIEVEQVSFLLFRHVVISFQESPEWDVFNPVRERLRSGKGKLRRSPPDYLLYCLLDSIIDSYYGVLERVGDRIERLEKELLADPSPKALERLHQIKNQVYFVRRAVWPLRELIHKLEMNDSKLFSDSTALYLRDLYDHAVQVLETIEFYRDVLTEMFDLYLSSTSYRMNSVMKVLTIITTIFMPLSFIAGIYGMNFRHMPELELYYGYPATLVVMGIVVIGMLRFFRVRGWL